MSNPPFSSVLLLFLSGLLSILISGSAMAIEEPKYRVIESAKPFELRVYDPKIIAEVAVSGSLKEASNKGFKLIADYIFGNNSSRIGLNKNETINMTAPVSMQENNKASQSEKISMTAPVSIKQTGDKWLMHFVMPSEYTLATLPKPNNPAVMIKAVDAKKYAVIQFSGLAGKEKTDRKTIELEKWLESRNIKTTAKPILARYNPPWTLPFFRRNEVMISY